MTYEVVVSRTFERAFQRLPKDTQKRIRKALQELESDPRTPRPRADIKPLHGTEPQKFRIRVGDYRTVYAVQANRVLVLDVFSRGREY